MRSATVVSTAGELAAADARTRTGLAMHAPQLLSAYRSALPAAADTVGRRLRAALVREGLGDTHLRRTPRRRLHAFGRVEFATAGVDDPLDLLPDTLPSGASGFAVEIADAVVNLALATARQHHNAGLPGSPDDPDLHAVAAERLAVTGHNLHPCGRTRLGWHTADVLAHDLEAGTTRVGFVAVRRDAHLGDDLGQVLRSVYPHLPDAPQGYVLQPVHAWQRDTIIAGRHARLLRDDTVRILDAEIDAAPTAALRTLLLPRAPSGHRLYVKVSLDILITSTRRSMSAASTRNGPPISALLHRLLADDPDGHRTLLLAETAGAAAPDACGRDLSAIVRDGLTARLTPSEQVIPGSALPATDPATGRSVLAGLVSRYAHTAGVRDDHLAAAAFLDAYARLLLPPLLRLITKHGIALEAHLQNCLPTFVAGAPHRLVLRDLAGLRLHPPRLGATGLSVPLWPGSVIGTDDADVLRAKLGYTALQAHLGELVIRLHESHGLDEEAAWRGVRAVIDDTYDPLLADPATHAAARADHRALTAARVPHKALVRMRLSGPGDIYLPVDNPLYAST